MQRWIETIKIELNINYTQRKKSVKKYLEKATVEGLTKKLKVWSCFWYSEAWHLWHPVNFSFWSFSNQCTQAEKEPESRCTYIESMSQRCKNAAGTLWAALFDFRASLLCPQLKDIFSGNSKRSPCPQFKEICTDDMSGKITYPFSIGSTAFSQTCA